MKTTVLALIFLFLTQSLGIANSDCVGTQTILQRIGLQFKRLEEFIIPSLKYRPEDIAKFMANDFNYSKSFLKQKFSKRYYVSEFKTFKFVKKIKNFPLPEAREHLNNYITLLKEKALHTELISKKINDVNKSKKLNQQQLNIRKILKELEVLLAKKDLSYLDFLDISADVTVALDETSDAFSFEKNVNKLKNSYFSNYQLAQNNNGILWPTTKNLHVKDFIDSSDAPIYFVGVIDEPTKADGKFFSPVGFANHDLQHFKIITSKNRSLGSMTDDFIKGFKLAIKDVDPVHRDFFEIFYFHYIHEMVPSDRDLYPFAMKRVFKSYLNKNTAELQRTVVNNMKRPVSISKIRDEIISFIEFLDTLPY